MRACFHNRCERTHFDNPLRLADDVNRGGMRIAVLPRAILSSLMPKLYADPTSFSRNTSGSSVGPLQRSDSALTITLKISSATLALQRSSANWESAGESALFSSIRRRWSAFMPEGPAAALHLAFLTLERNQPSSRENFSTGSKLAISSGTGSLGNFGRRSGSRSARNVALVPGATDAPSSACLPADASPNCANRKARRARISTLSRSLILRLSNRGRLHAGIQTHLNENIPFSTLEECNSIFDRFPRDQSTPTRARQQHARNKEEEFPRADLEIKIVFSHPNFTPSMWLVSTRPCKFCGETLGLSA